MKLFFGFILVVVATAKEFKLIKDEYRFTEEEACGANAEYHSCGSTCFPTCFIHNNYKPCLRVCISGCNCKAGFVEARNGTCIRPLDCPREKPNTIFDHNCFDEPKKGECTSDIPMWYYERETGYCLEFYYGGCGGNGNRYTSEEECLKSCREGFETKEQCGENSRYNSCGTACPLTCENYKNPPQSSEFDVMMCNIGCQCNEGYVQNKDGNCVLPENCPNKDENRFTKLEACGANAEYHSCGSTCFPTCFIHYNYKPCLRVCIPGCNCKAGFVEARNGTCIRPLDCPRERPNTIFDHNCFDKPKKGECRSDIPMWYYEREKGYCLEFYYGGCGGNGNRYTSEEECLKSCREGFVAKEQCGENSRYNSCGTACPLTCENNENPPRYCVMRCNIGCQCNEGYVQTKDGNCVLPENCPNKDEN